MPIVELLVMDFVLGPVLEESVLRGCLLPVLAQTTEESCDALIQRNHEI